MKTCRICAVSSRWPGKRLLSRWSFSTCGPAVSCAFPPSTQLIGQFGLYSTSSRRPALPTDATGPLSTLQPNHE